MMHERQKSDLGIVAMKLSNKHGRPRAEMVERRPRAKGNMVGLHTHRTQGRARVSRRLDRVRQVARQRKKERFTSLFHYVDTDLLRESFFWLQRKAAAGVDGVTWQDYECDLEVRLIELQDRLHRGPNGRYRRGGSTSPNRTEHSVRWGSPHWRTRSSSASWWRY